MKEADLIVYGFAVHVKYRGSGKDIEVIKISIAGGVPDAMGAGDIIDECREMLIHRDQTGELPVAEEAKW